MQAGDRSKDTRREQDYSSLPPSPKLDETIGSVHAGPVPDPDAGRDLDQHRALRDD